MDPQRLNGPATAELPRLFTSIDAPSKLGGKSRETNRFDLHHDVFPRTSISDGILYKYYHGSFRCNYCSYAMLQLHCKGSTMHSNRVRKTTHHVE